MRIAAISDTHTLPFSALINDLGVDTLVYAGDESGYGTMKDWFKFIKQLEEINCKYKLYVPGNHSRYVEKNIGSCRADLFNVGADLLIDQEILIEGKRFYGSPWTPTFFNWAFMNDRGPEIRAKWDLIPDDLDVLITHGPPKGYGDTAPGTCYEVGCEDLLNKLIDMRDKVPKHVIYGHIHYGYGNYKLLDRNCLLHNVSHCSESYQGVNPPLVLDI